jgi:hypothetical protein
MFHLLLLGRHQNGIFPPVKCFLAGKGVICATAFLVYSLSSADFTLFFSTHGVLHGFPHRDFW